MKRSDEFKLKVLSLIKPEIIDRNSKKRYELMMRASRPKRNRKWMIPSTIAAVLLLAVLGVWLFGSGNGLKQVPIYQGMSVSSTLPNTSASVDEHYLLLGEQQGGQPQDDEISGDHKDGHENPDSDKPFGDEPPIEEEVKSSLEVVGGARSIFYAQPNQTVYITVHINNPDAFEILSFTLNGVKYTSYMFKEGSDLENLILEVNVGAVEGIQEYTIDAIKYVDGTEIKDVRMDGDRTVRVGVATDKQPTASVANESIGFNDISFDVVLDDPLSLINQSGGRVYAVLYDGETILETVEVWDGRLNTVRFKELKTNTLYQYAIVADYDSLSGNGRELITLYKKAFYTNAIVLFDAVTVSQEGLSFGYAWHENASDKQISLLSLWKDGAKISDLSASATSVSGLLSGHTYTLIASYWNDDKTEQISITFTTQAKTAPTVSVTNPTKTQTSIGFGISVTDPDQLCTLTKIELVHANGTVEADSLDVRAFENLLSNNDYTVKITYTYDLNDGKGLQTANKTLVIKTKAKVAPVVSLSINNVTETSISYSYTLTDVDSVLATLIVRLLDADGNVIATATDTAGAFEGLTASRKYTVVVEYTFDLNDGVGVRMLTKSISTATVKILSITAQVPVINAGASVTIQIKIEDIPNVTLQSVMIDGKEVSLTKTALYYYATFSPKSTGGKYTVILGTMSFDGGSVPMNYVSDLDILVMGEISVDSVVLSNGTHYYWSGEDVTAYVNFIGSEPFTITKVYIESGYVNAKSEILIRKVTDVQYALESIPTDPFRITGFVYEYNGKTYEVTTNQIDVLFIEIPKQTSPIEISTPEQLQNMQPGRDYILTQDIDMSGFDWTPFQYYGVLNGNGYTIRNLTLDGVTSMFKNSGSNCYIVNLNLENVLLSVYVPEAVPNFYVAILSTYDDEKGKNNGPTVANCHITGSIELVLEVNDSEEVADVISLFAFSRYGLITDSSFNGSMNLTVKKTFQGGYYVFGMVSTSSISYGQLVSGEIDLTITAGDKVLKKTLTSLHETTSSWEMGAEATEYYTVVGDCVYVTQGVKTMHRNCLPDSWSNINFTKVVIPKTVKAVGWDTFSTDSTLTIVYYEGSEAEWKNVAIGGNNDALSNATMYFYSESRPTTAGNY